MAGRTWFVAACAAACVAVGVANRVPDPYKPGDPIHDDEFKGEYLHVDGSINEKVLIMLQKYSPAAAGAMSAIVGFILFMLIFLGFLFCFMSQNDCWKKRDNLTTERLQEARRAEYAKKINAQQREEGHV